MVTMFEISMLMCQIKTSGVQIAGSAALAVFELGNILNRAKENCR